MKEDKPIVRLLFVKMKSDFQNLSKTEKLAFMEKDRTNLDELGMTAISMIDCSETNDEWDYIGVEKWPSRRAITKREKYEKEELRISKYVEYKTYIGYEQSFESYGK